MKLTVYSNGTDDVFNNALIGYNGFYHYWLNADNALINALYGARYM